CIVITAENVTEQKRAEEALRASEARFKLLADTSARLLAAEDPKSTIENLCAAGMQCIRSQMFLCFLTEADTSDLRLLCCAGVSDEAARALARLRQSDQAQRGAALVQAYGIRAHCCHPLRVGGRKIGSLWFGTSSRQAFAPDDVE